MKNMEKLGHLLAAIRQVYIQWAKDKGVNYTTFAILYTVYCRGSCTQKDVCDVWNLAKQTVSTQCSELMDQGLLSSVQNSENRRQKILTLTEKGQAFAQPFSEGIYRAEIRAFEALGTELSAQLIAGAEQFYRVFGQEAERERGA